MSDKETSYDEMMDNVSSKAAGEIKKSLSIEELLKPRYKVIDGYPDSHYPVGTILDRDWARYPDDDETKPAIWRISQYPRLFRKLEWWEERTEDEMPKYVKPKMAPHYVFELIKVNGGYFYIGFDGKIKSDKFEVFLPATEEEYLQQNTPIKHI